MRINYTVYKHVLNLGSRPPITAIIIEYKIFLPSLGCTRVKTKYDPKKGSQSDIYQLIYISNYRNAISTIFARTQAKTNGCYFLSFPVRFICSASKALTQMAHDTLFAFKVSNNTHL
jgi:hypothetical protein